jgi:hypothetical protein
LVIGHSTLNGEFNIFIYNKMSREIKIFKNKKEPLGNQWALSSLGGLLKGGKLSNFVVNRKLLNKKQH